MQVVAKDGEEGRRVGGCAGGEGLLCMMNFGERDGFRCFRRMGGWCGSGYGEVSSAGYVGWEEDVP